MVLDLNRPRITSAMAVAETDEHCTPILDLILRPFQLISLSEVRVVIVGQNPYDTTHGMANGIAFALDQGSSPTINAISTELIRTYKRGLSTPDLLHWVQQGVLLLNTTFTTTIKEYKSDVDHVAEWFFFTRHLLQYISTHSDAIFMLWGRHAHDLARDLSAPSARIIKDPFPLARTGFIGSDAFLKCDKAMQTRNLNVIDWTN